MHALRERRRRPGSSRTAMYRDVGRPRLALAAVDFSVWPALGLVGLRGIHHRVQGTVTRLPMSGKYFLHSACPASATVARPRRGFSVAFGASAACRPAVARPASAGCADTARTRTRATKALFMAVLLTGLAADACRCIGERRGVFSAAGNRRSATRTDAPRSAPRGAPRRASRVGVGVDVGPDPEKASFPDSTPTPRWRRRLAAVQELLPP